jgi:hypothetical protein
MKYKTDKKLILESLLQEELSPIAKKGMAVAGLGAGAALANAGTFGTGIQNATRGAWDATKGMVNSAGERVGSELKQAGEYYGNDKPTARAPGDTVNETPNLVKNNVEHKLQNSIDKNTDNADNDDESTFGLGSLAAAAGLGAAGLYGASKAVPKMANSKLGQATKAGIGEFKKSFNQPRPGAVKK